MSLRLSFFMFRLLDLYEILNGCENHSSRRNPPDEDEIEWIRRLTAVRCNRASCGRVDLGPTWIGDNVTEVLPQLTSYTVPPCNGRSTNSCPHGTAVRRTKLDFLPVGLNNRIRRLGNSRSSALRCPDPPESIVSCPARLSTNWRLSEPGFDKLSQPNSHPVGESKIIEKCNYSVI